MESAHKQAFCGSWEGISAGGSLEYASWRYNPQLFLTGRGRVTVALRQEGEGPRFALGLYVAPSDGSGYRMLTLRPDMLTAHSGRKGVCFVFSFFLSSLAVRSLATNQTQDGSNARCSQRLL